MRTTNKTKFIFYTEMIDRGKRRLILTVVVRGRGSMSTESRRVGMDHPIPKDTCRTRHHHHEPIFAICI